MITATWLPRLIHSGDYCPPIKHRLQLQLVDSLTVPASVLFVPDLCLKEPETSLRLSLKILRRSIPRDTKAVFLGFEYCLRSPSERGTAWETVEAEANELVKCLAGQIEALHVRIGRVDKRRPRCQVQVPGGCLLQVGAHETAIIITLDDRLRGHRSSFSATD
jgi:hypothetical protein